MLTRLKSVYQLFVPAHVHNPGRLARRMVTSRNPTALFTLFIAVLGILCIPFDMLLSIRERRLLSSAAAMPARPTVFVCGPARSGTTLAFQILCRHLDVSYLQNVTALFPRSPIVASRIYRRLFRSRRDGAPGYKNYYGKTSGLGGPTEGNHLWSRWVQPDATGFRTKLSAAGAREMARFISAFGEIDQKAIVCKNTNMNVFADVVADAMPNLLVICLRRSPDFLAQSLLQARLDIHGSVSHGYGVQDVDNLDDTFHPIASVCAQVEFLNRVARESQARIGEDGSGSSTTRTSARIRASSSPPFPRGSGSRCGRAAPRRRSHPFRTQRRAGPEGSGTHSGQTAGVRRHALKGDVSLARATAGMCGQFTFGAPKYGFTLRYHPDIRG